MRGANKTTFLTDSGEVTMGVFVASKQLFHPLNSAILVDNDETNGGGFLRWTGDLDLAGHRNDVTLGANYFAGVNHAKVFGNAGGSRGALSANSDQTSRTAEVYGENAFYIVPTVALIGGLQGTLAQRDYEDKFLSNGNQSFDRDYDSVNPKLGARWDYADQQQAFANLSWSSEPPPFSELGTTTVQNNLKDQESKTLELGLRGRSGDLAWDAAAYYAWIENELQFQTVNGTTSVFNADKTIHQGFELGGEWAALRNSFSSGDKTALRLAYTFSDFRFDNDAVYRNNDIPGAPKHFLRAELRYSHASGWYAGPNVEWVPEGYYVDNANSLKTPSYAVLGAKAGYDFGGGLKAFVDGRNLLDKTYISNTSVAASATATSALFNPGDGRAVYAGIEYRW